MSVELEKALHDLQILQEVALPLCMVCHKIHTTDEYWIRLEDFFAKNTDIMFSHGICPDCVKQTYGKLGEQMLIRLMNGGQGNRRQKSKQLRPDESLTEMRSIVERALSENNPLAPDLEKIVSRHAKLLRRFDKIVSISDSYQAQLREFNLRLELMAHTDPLTGLYNRGYFLDLLNTEVNRASRHERVFCVLMLDLDHFKLVNDTYGHAAGDEALRCLTRIIQSCDLRKSDFIGRIGGEEFAICLPETDIDGAGEVAEKLRAALEKTAVIFKGEALFITASIGASEFKVGDTEDTLLQRADYAMYQAKENGRNKVCVEKTFA